MGRWERLLETARASPSNVRFKDLRALVEHLGFVERRHRGSHRIYQHPERRDMPLINLQADRSGKAKPYQVRQVLALIERYDLEVKS